jgi:hypothetical protein
MTNSDSLDAESATAPTTKPESASVNMSAGAEMLIERMKTNPDDFNYGGKFYRVVEAMNAPHGQGWVSERDQEALRGAYAEHIQEAEFSEWVYNEIFNPKEPEKDLHKMYAQAQSQGQRAQMQNAMRSSMYASGMTNPLQGVMWQGAVPETANANTTSVFGSIKNKLGI